MKLTTQFTILNRKFNEMDLIRDATRRRKLATERLHNDFRKMYKKTNLLISLKMKFLLGFGLINQVQLSD